MVTGSAAAWRLEGSVAPSDEEIVREVLGGASARFDLLVRRHRARLRRLVRGVVRDRAEAEDVLQQTLLQAFAGLGGWSGTAPFAVWLMRIAMNEALMRVRRSRRQERAAVQLARQADGPRHTPEQLASSREEMALVSAALPRLSQRHREILQLATLHDLSRADVARRLGVSQGAAKVRLHRAREALRGLLRERGAPRSVPTPRLVLAALGPGLIGSGWREELHPR